MIIDGRKISREVKEELKNSFASFQTPKKLAVISVGGDRTTEQFIRIKKRFAEDIGVLFERYEFESSEEESLLMKIKELNQDDSVQGIVIQLPLAPQMDRERICGNVSLEKDVDVLGKKSCKNFEKFLSIRSNSSEKILFPPVVRAVERILTEGNIGLREKKILVIGRGKLVGEPLSLWARSCGAYVNVVEKGDDFAGLLKKADIIFSGAGESGILRPEMIKDGCVLVDAGTSESSGVVMGDADPRCAEKCLLFTPVPGGVGPVTVASLFENLLQASKQAV
jgi:5,10-methylene-tetrahydrofolate dehydrogenase/methenyl tetrahydrofolate cyclohydrolase